MNQPIEKICVLGAGSAGYLSAVTLKRLLPDRQITAVHSTTKPVIGVGESTTAYIPVFLHDQLALDQKRFYSEVQPSWKLGLRLIWGPPDISHFNYAFNFELSERAANLRKRAAFYCLSNSGFPGPVSALMDHDLSPCLQTQSNYSLLESSHGFLPIGYHIDNKRFLAYLDRVARELGVDFVTGDVVETTRNATGDIESLKFDDGREVAADMFLDCSGFDSFLLEKTLGQRFVSYADRLFCDTAVVGSTDRVGTVRPYTTAETMEHGWCWQIDFPERITRGYVHSSQFCTVEEAIQEMERKNPELTGNSRSFTFPCGRYENFWVGNVVAIGNACGFVEPLEATALHMIAQQLVGLCSALLDSDYRIEPRVRELENERFRRSWDEIRDFLALHYKFNTRFDTPFWQHCRETIDLGGAQPLVEMYQELGPHRACKKVLPQESLFSFEGYLSMLVGQRVPTNCENRFNQEDWLNWNVYQENIRQLISRALPVRQALQVVNSSAWRWKR